MSNKVKDDLDKFHDYGISMSTRTILLGSHGTDDEGHITPETAESFIKNIYLLSQTRDEITIIINTPGGDVESGLAIYDAIKNCNCYVTGIIHKAESMGAVITQACDKRLMMPNASFMYHKGTIGFDSTHRSTAYKWVERAKHDDRVCDSIIFNKIKEKKPKFTKLDFSDLIEHDKWFTPNQAIQYNLIDEVYGQQ